MASSSVLSQAPPRRFRTVIRPGNPARCFARLPFSMPHTFIRENFARSRFFFFLLPFLTPFHPFLPRYFAANVADLGIFGANPFFFEGKPLPGPPPLFFFSLICRAASCPHMCPRCSFCPQKLTQRPPTNSFLPPPLSLQPYKLSHFFLPLRCTRSFTPLLFRFITFGSEKKTPTP